MTSPRKPGSSDLEVFPLCLGGNVFGWTADEAQSFAVLDAYAAAGGNFVDTADCYSAWGEGNSGGQSETIIGRWVRARGNRDDVVIATKVSQHPEYQGLSAANITPERLKASLGFSDREGLARYVALQPHYNLVSRATYEGALQDVVAASGLFAVPYFALASGFLTGKYRPGTTVGSPRAEGAGAHLETDRGVRVLAARDGIARDRGGEPATVALAWLAAQPTVAAPIASARTVEQLPALLAVADVTLTEEEVGRLTEASA